MAAFRSHFVFDLLPQELTDAEGRQSTSNHMTLALVMSTLDSTAAHPGYTTCSLDMLKIRLKTNFVIA